MELELKLEDHIGLKPVYGSDGAIVAHQEVDTKLKRIKMAVMLDKLDGSPPEKCWQQIGWLHPNSFVSLIITPPEGFVDEVRERVEEMIGRPLRKVGFPPPLSGEE